MFDLKLGVRTAILLFWIIVVFVSLDVVCQTLSFLLQRIIHDEKSLK